MVVPVPVNTDNIGKISFKTTQQVNPVTNSNKKNATAPIKVDQPNKPQESHGIIAPPSSSVILRQPLKQKSSALPSSNSPHNGLMKCTPVSKSWDTQSCQAYAFDILHHCLINETKNICSKKYVNKIAQLDCNDKARAVLVDWMIDSAFKFKMMSSTLFMAVNIIDRFCERVNVPRDHIQIYGVAALFIAGKYEEIYPPDLIEYQRLTNLSKSAILQAEGLILNELNLD